MTSAASVIAQPILAVRNVEKRFPGVHALKDVSIEIGRSEVIGLVGENGAGKSTLMRILAGVYQPDSGEILLAGRRTRLSTASDAMRQGIGMVFQEQSLIPNLSVAENIYLGNEARFTRFGRIDGRRCTPERGGNSPRSRSTSIRACAQPTLTWRHARWWSSPRR